MKLNFQGNFEILDLKNVFPSQYNLCAKCKKITIFNICFLTQSSENLYYWIKKSRRVQQEIRIQNSANF